MSSSSGIYFEDCFIGYADLLADIFELRGKVAPNTRISLRNPNALELLVVLLSLGSHVDEICIFPSELEMNEEYRGREMYFGEDEFQKEFLFNTNKSFGTSVQSKIIVDWSAKLTIFSSGTSGVPKSSTHVLSHLLKQFDYQKTTQTNITWGMLYQTSRMAAIQLLLNAFVRRQSIVCKDNKASLREKIDIFALQNANALSGTPSVFRYLLQFDQFRNLPLIQITLGGELVDQEILNTLKFCFPKARITHIYASTEVGFGFAVSDGLSGFPSEYFSHSFGRFSLEAINDELVFTFPGDSRNPKGYSIFSGDVIKREGDRVYFVGRRSSMVNVGGLKVFPEEVETTIRGIAGVINVQVYSVKSSQMGEILMAKVVCEPSLNPASIRLQLKEVLPPHKVPALVEKVKELPIAPSGKALRL